MSFTHLHLHSEYSLLDGACRIDELMNAVKEMGMYSVAITDHGVMYGVVDFYKSAKKHGIKPIIGCEVYVAPRRLEDKVHGVDSEYSHLVLLCENLNGYKNLCRIVSKSFVDGFYFKPRVDKELLRKYSDGLIALSACLQGEIPKAIVANDYENAVKIAEDYVEIFGVDNFFLELQDHGLENQNKVNTALIEIADKIGVRLVATNDVHYVNKSDAKMQECLMLIGTNHTIKDDDKFVFACDEFYLKSENEMRSLFKNRLDAVDNTNIIAERCNVDFEFGNTILPNFDTPNNENHYDFLRNNAYTGLKNRGLETKEYIDRMEYELKVINEMGYVDYFLIVADYVNYAKNNDIPVGPGRGSGAASLVAYCIGITDIDPIKYDLLFERFLNPERVTMPDFDVDFCARLRPKMIEYVRERYGDDHVAQIVTFGTLAARAAVRDVGRAMALPYTTVDAVAKAIPNVLDQTLENALNESDELKRLYSTDKNVRDLVDMAKRIEGMPRHASMHAAGVVITPQPVCEIVPLATSDSNIITQFPMTTLEELGLLKMDFLGLKNLTITDDCIKNIHLKNPNFDINQIPDNDELTFKLFSTGKTNGIFQFESDGMKRVIRELKPRSIEDLTAVTSLYRPGPSQSIPEYIKNKHNPQNIKYKTELLRPILNVTYGCLVYQEQVMQVFRSLAGYSFARADIVRRAMSKKKHDVLNKERDKFVEGCKENGISIEDSNELFDKINAFSSYAFNKAHAVCYATIAYRNAYLKAHFPKEFMSALMTSVLDSPAKIQLYVNECMSMGIDVFNPDINIGKSHFTSYENGIIFGLSAIKNVSYSLIENVVSERNLNGQFTSFQNFCERMRGKGINRKSIECLIKSGCFDSFNFTRKTLIESLDKVLAYISETGRREISGQIGLFDVAYKEAPQFVLPKLDEYDKNELVAMEREVLGFSISSNPLQDYKEIALKLGCANLNDITEKNDNQNIKLIGIIGNIKKKQTRNGDSMEFVSLDTYGGNVELIVFPKVLIKYFNLLKINNIILIEGKVSTNDDGSIQIIVDTVSIPSTTEQKSLYIKVSSQNSDDFRVALATITQHRGNDNIYFCFADTKKTLKYNKFGVDTSEKSINHIKSMVGSNNVVLK